MIGITGKHYNIFYHVNFHNCSYRRIGNVQLCKFREISVWLSKTNLFNHAPLGGDPVEPPGTCTNTPTQKQDFFNKKELTSLPGGGGGVKNCALPHQKLHCFRRLLFDIIIPI